MNHNGAVSFAVCAGIFRLKSQGKLEIQLNRSALPSPSQGILQVEIDLGSIESAVALIDAVGYSQFI